MTNYSKFISMTKTELARWLVDNFYCHQCPSFAKCYEITNCDDEYIKWLNEEYKYDKEIL